MVRSSRRAGAKILAGGDLGSGWVIVRVGVRQEFRELAKASLSPLQVLQTATLNGAEFLRYTATRERLGRQERRSGVARGQSNRER